MACRGTASYASLTRYQSLSTIIIGVFNTSTITFPYSTQYCDDPVAREPLNMRFLLMTDLENVLDKTAVERFLRQGSCLQ